MEAQRFPEDFDGMMPMAPVYDLVGRVMAGAWWAQAVSDEQRGSVLNRTVAETVHKSVLARCGAQAGVEEGLVTEARLVRLEAGDGHVLIEQWRPRMPDAAPGRGYQTDDEPCRELEWAGHLRVS